MIPLSDDAAMARSIPPTVRGWLPVKKRHETGPTPARPFAAPPVGGNKTVSSPSSSRCQHGHIASHDAAREAAASLLHGPRAGPRVHCPRCLALRRRHERQHTIRTKLTAPPPSGNRQAIPHGVSVCVHWSFLGPSGSARLQIREVWQVVPQGLRRASHSVGVASKPRDSSAATSYGQNDSK